MTLSHGAIGRRYDPRVRQVHLGHRKRGFLGVEICDELSLLRLEYSFAAALCFGRRFATASKCVRLNEVRIAYDADFHRMIAPDFVRIYVDLDDACLPVQHRVVPVRGVLIQPRAEREYHVGVIDRFQGLGRAAVAGRADEQGVAVGHRASAR